MSNGCSTAKEQGDDAKAITMIKRLAILTMLRRTELDGTGSVLPSRFAITCAAAAIKRTHLERAERNRVEITPSSVPAPRG